MPQTDDEKRLVGSCIEGDPAAWEAFVGRYSRIVVASIRKTLSSKGRIADQNEVDAAFQEVFFEIWRDGVKALRRFSWNCSLETYLWVIAHRKALERVGRTRETTGDGVAEESAATRADFSASPAEEIERRETREMVKKAVSQLPERDREAITMYYLDGLPMESVADKLSLSVPSAAMVVLRARKKLSKIIGKTGKNAL